MYTIPVGLYQVYQVLICMPSVFQRHCFQNKISKNEKNSTDLILFYNVTGTSNAFILAKNCLIQTN